MTRSIRQEGFSLVELIVAVAIVAVAAFVAVPVVSTMMRAADTRQAFVETANAARRRASSAVGGERAAFSAERDGHLSAGLTINPKYIPAPEGTEPVSEIEFEAQTGTARVAGRRAVVSIVIAEAGTRDFAHAIVAGTAGRIELKTYTNGRWSEFK
jgi:prepilin-type N-terminal cleavage/methylation domain-containing protein